MTGANVTIPGVVNATEIGRGGFGVVYRATESDLGRDVAVKILSGELDERTRTRFERERRAMGTLSSHPNIITIFRSGIAENGGLYLVMEYLPGGSLAQHIVATGPTGWEDTLRIGIELCGALESAHRAGVLHRDVKPGNIMMDNLGRSKLGDFGIARLDGSPETKSAVITASVAHAPPEVIAGEKPDERSDVYSLASTLFELTNGTPAFVRPTDESMIPMFARIVHEPAPDLRQKGVPDAVASVLEKAMAKGADQRYNSAAEFGRALAGIQRQLGVSETRLWIEGEPAPEQPTDQHTQIVAPPVSNTPVIPPQGPPSPPTGPAPSPPPGQGYPGQQPSGPAPVPSAPPGPTPGAPDYRGQPPGAPQAPPQGPGPQAPQPQGPYQQPQGPQPQGPQPQGPAQQPYSQPAPPNQQPIAPAATGGQPVHQFAQPAQPSTGYVTPPNQTGGYGPPQQPYAPTPASGGSGQGSKAGLIAAIVLGALVLIVGGTILATADRNDQNEDAQTLVDSTDGDTDSTTDRTVAEDTTTTTTTIPTTTTTVAATIPPRPDLLIDLPSLPSVEAPYEEYRSVSDADGAFSMQAPSAWVDVLPTEGQVIVSPDNNAALADELISGVIVSGTQGVGAWDADFFLDELLKSLADPDAPCSPVKREPYDNGVFDGLLYAELCGGGDLLVVDLIVANANRDAVIFIGVQMTDERDMAAFQRIIDSFLLADPALLPPVS